MKLETLESELFSVVQGQTAAFVTAQIRSSSVTSSISARPVSDMPVVPYKPNTPFKNCTYVKNGTRTMEYCKNDSGWSPCSLPDWEDRCVD